MDKIIRKTGPKQEFEYEAYIYTEEEASNKGIQWLYWKDERVKEGDWVITDDLYVVQVRSVKEYTNRRNKTNRFLLTTIAPAWVTKQAKLLWEPRKEIGDYSGTHPDRWVNREKRKGRTRRAIKLYVNMLVNGKVDLQKCGQLYRPDIKWSTRAFKQLLKKEEIQEMVQDELQKLFEREGITREFIVQKHKQAIELGEGKNDGYLILKAANMLAKYLGWGERQQVDTNHMLGYAQTLEEIGQTLQNTETLTVDGHKVSRITEIQRDGQDADFEDVEERPTEVREDSSSEDVSS